MKAPAGQRFTGGTAYASSCYDTGVQHWNNAFDNNASTFWQSARNYGPWWIAYILTDPIELTTYTITPRSDDKNRAPMNFQLQGSNDTTNGSDGTWDTLDTVTGQIYATATPHTFTVDNPGFYKAYRLYITAVNDSYGTCNLAEWVGFAWTKVVTPDMEGGPDFVNVKSRTGTTYWHLNDTVRGPMWSLFTNSDLGAANHPSGLTLFNSDGYSFGSNGNYVAAGYNFLDLCLKAGTKQGFEIVKYNGEAGEQQIAHTLGKAPSLILIKRIDTTGNWTSYWEPLGADKHLRLNSTNAAGSDTDRWNSKAPTANTSL